MYNPISGQINYLAFCTSSPLSGHIRYLEN